MTTQNYLIIQNNVVINVVLWDGNDQTWMPPNDSIQLIQSNIPALIWIPVITNNIATDWVLEEVIGAGDIGFTWNGTILTTNEPKPIIVSQPVTNGLVQA